MDTMPRIQMELFSLKRKRINMRGFYLVFVTLLIFACNGNVVTYYNTEKSKIIDGRTNSIIKSDFFECNGRVGFYNESSGDHGIELVTEIHNDPETIVKSISYSVRPKKHSKPNFHYCYFLVKDQGRCNQSELQTNELIEAVNNNSWTTAVHHFPVNNEEYDSLFIDYKVDLVFKGSSHQLIGTEIFRKGTFKQPLSR